MAGEGKQKQKLLSAVRAEAGRSGAAARWGAGPRATACLRCYPEDAAEIRRRAAVEGRLPADIVKSALEGH